MTQGSPSTSKPVSVIAQEAEPPTLHPVGSSDVHPDCRSTRWLVLFIFLGSILRVLFIARNSLWSDEIVTLQIASLSWRDFWQVLSSSEANMGLYYLLLRPWIHLGSTEAVLRALSAIAGILTIPAAYKLAKALFGTRIALITAFLFSINPCDVFFSQQARSYSLQILLVTLSMWLFFTCIRQDRPRSWSPWFWYVLASTLAVYAHFFSALILLAQWIAAAFLPGARNNLRRVVPAAIVVTALVSPLVVFTLRHNVGQLDWIQPLNALEVFRLVGFFCAGTSRVLGLVLSAFAIVLIVLVIRARKSAKYDRTTSLALLFAFLCLVLPVSITALASIWKPIFVHRYLVVSLPAFLLVLACGFGLLRGAIYNWALATFAALSLIAIFSLRPVEDWRSAVAYIVGHARSADTVVIYRPYSERGFKYYLQRRCESGCSAELQFVGPSTDFEDSVFKQAHPRVWLVLSAVDGPATSIQKRLRDSYLPSERRIYSGVQVELFSTAPNRSGELPERTQ